MIEVSKGREASIAGMLDNKEDSLIIDPTNDATGMNLQKKAMDECSRGEENVPPPSNQRGRQGKRGERFRRAREHA